MKNFYVARMVLDGPYSFNFMESKTALEDLEERYSDKVEVYRIPKEIRTLVSRLMILGLPPNPERSAISGVVEKMAPDYLVIIDSLPAEEVLRDFNSPRRYRSIDETTANGLLKEISEREMVF